MQILIDRQGTMRCLYAELIDLRVLGSLSIERASFVEPDDQGRWWADLTPVGGPALGPFQQRSDALSSENCWLEQNWLHGALSSKHERPKDNS
jgi:hypothetical protein